MTTPDITASAPFVAPTGRVVDYPDDAVLTPRDVAAWLAISTKQVMRYPIARIALGGRTTRFFARDVKAFLQQRAAA